MIKFERGSFLKREDPFFTKDAYSVYDRIVTKYNVPNGAEVMICMRHDNHNLLKSWTNVKSMPSSKEILAAAKR